VYNKDDFALQEELQDIIEGLKNSKTIEEYNAFLIYLDDNTAGGMSLREAYAQQQLNSIRSDDERI
jgi:hypothetical protein